MGRWDTLDDRVAQRRHAEARRLLLDATRVGHHHIRPLHQLQHRQVVERRAQRDVRRVETAGVDDGTKQFLGHFVFAL